MSVNMRNWLRRRIWINSDFSLMFQPLFAILEKQKKRLDKKYGGIVLERNISVITDLDGNRIVVIHDIIFKGKKAINWDEVKKYLEVYVGEFYEIADTKDIVYIGKDLPDEFTGSKYTYTLKGANAKAKANASQGIPEMLEIASGKYFRENSGEKHQRNAATGWYRYDSRFALPVYDEHGEIERYNVFHASMLIRHANDGKMYLYDILDIKKETSNPFRF